MKVLKFGGSSLATPARIREVGRIVLDEARREPLIVVVSAFQGITNQLLECARLAERGDRRYEQRVSSRSPCGIARRSTISSDRARTPHARRGRRAARRSSRDALHGIACSALPAARARHDGELRRAPVGADRRGVPRIASRPARSRSTRVTSSSPTISSRAPTSSSHGRIAPRATYFAPCLADRSRAGRFRS